MELSQRVPVDRVDARERPARRLSVRVPLAVKQRHEPLGGHDGWIVFVLPDQRDDLAAAGVDLGRGKLRLAEDVGEDRHDLGVILDETRADDRKYVAI